MALVVRPPPDLAQKTPGVPSQTLYVRNLPDKLSKDDLRRNLYMLFATYGVILDIVALKTPRMRGQAHVVFRDTDSSTQAMRALDGFNFFGKDITIYYGKGRSNVIPKLAGTFTVPGIEPGLARGLQTEDGENGSKSPADGFGAAPAKAVPVNQPDRAKGTKRTREEEEEEEEDDSSDDGAAEMQMSDSDEE
ncbi:U2 small nuclear ribonucleoprotein B [Massarina eburnea CBS 473.64]|uniref:U2 small nuclear ribonucleoprotein B n=1 Tax=Massarina eburnea CBS 473.64 TaxID=1395130 RepID=A0A6A6SD78_9PLEO|nr:U2 small nuclear ribonucleoprotein B [Massarina eburnea CBS 473.64]